MILEKWQRHCVCLFVPVNPATQWIICVCYKAYAHYPLKLFDTCTLAPSTREEHEHAR